MVERALAKRPEDRYPSAGDLGRAALAAAAGEPVTEQERTVATGAAAPSELLTAAMPTELLGRTDEPWEPPVHAPALKRRRAWKPRRGALGLLTVAAISTAVAAVMIVRDGGTAGASSQLSTGEVRDAADAFASAIASEDSAALSHLLARDVKRVFPADSQRGRAAVLATYRGQFSGNEITGYDLSDLDVGGGRAGRAEGRYELRRGGQDPTGGTIVLGIKRERGQAKVALIAAEPG